MRRLGFFLLCAYIAFNVLDVDGSDSPYRLGPALTPASGAAESDRGFLTAPPPGPAGAGAVELAADSRPRIDLGLPSPRLLQRQCQRPHRPDIRRESCLAPIPAADPV